MRTQASPRVACSRHHRSVPPMTADEEITYEAFKEQMREKRRQEQALVDAFVNAVSTANIKAYGPAFADLASLHYSPVWPRVVRAVEHADPPLRFRRHCLWSWPQWRDSFRNNVNNDLLLIKLLRVLLPEYRGPVLTLYRGETMWNRRRRTYGVSWTSEVEVAKQYANGLRRTTQGGTVVLKTRASTGDHLCAQAAQQSFRSRA